LLFVVAFSLIVVVAGACVNCTRFSTGDGQKFSGLLPFPATSEHRHATLFKLCSFFKFLLIKKKLMPGL